MRFVRRDGGQAGIEHEFEDEERAMTQPDGQTQRPAEKDPGEWVTGDEPMTGPQESYLSTLATEAGEPAPADLTKAEASEKIEELQGKTGRGQGAS
jgi:hypothetical protein